MIHQAVEMNLQDVVTYLLDQQVNIKTPDIYGNTVCDIAKLLKHDDILQILLNYEKS